MTCRTTHAVGLECNMFGLLFVLDYASYIDMYGTFKSTLKSFLFG